MVAHRTLTPFVRVRILHPLPKTGCPLDNRFFYGFCIFQTVKELSSQKLRREETCERKPSGCPFASNHPPQRQNCKIRYNKILFCNSESSLSKESKGAVASSQHPAGWQDSLGEFENSSHIVPTELPPGLFPFTVLHIIENYGIFSVKILTKKLRGDMLDLPRKEGSPRNELFCRHRK